MKWTAALRNLRGNALSGLERFPIALLSLAVFVAMINLEIAGAVVFDDELAIRAGAAFGAGAATAAATVLFGERRGWDGALRHGASLLLALPVAGAIWFWERLGVAPPALLLATVLTIPLAPYVRRGLNGFWAFTWRLAHAAGLAFITVIVFCLGLSAILASLEYLFGIHIAGSFYGHVWSTGLGFVGPLFALSLLPEIFPDADRPEGADILVAGVRILADFVAVPLLATYALILHAYALRILAVGEVPRNQIGWMVLSFGLAVLVLRVVVHPFGGLARLPTRLFLRFWAVPLIVPLLLLVIAAGLRIAGHGITPERYGLALFALFLAIVLIAQVPRRTRGDIRVIPAVGCVCLLLASFGPWGALSASAASQTARLIQRLESVAALDGGRLRETPELPAAAARDIHSIVWLLSEIGQLERLRPLFQGRPDDPFQRAAEAEGSRRDLVAQVHKALGADDIRVALDPSGTFWLDPSGSAAVPIAGYDLMVPALTWNSAPIRVSLGDADLSVELRPEGIIIGQGAVTVRVPVEELRNGVAEHLQAVEQNARAPRPPPFLEVTVDGRRFGLLLDGVGGQLTETEFRLDSGRLHLFLRRADWAG